MTREKMIEALAEMLENYRCGRDGNTADECAAAVLDLCGPKRLVWQRNGKHWACGRDGLVIRMQSAKRFVLTRRNAFDQSFDTIESAQAAAQAHADAAHWANTLIADMIEGKE
jgi:hypothetical protein